MKTCEGVEMATSVLEYTLFYFITFFLYYFYVLFFLFLKSFFFFLLDYVCEREHIKYNGRRKKNRHSMDKNVENKIIQLSEKTKKKKEKCNTKKNVCGR